MKIKISMSIIAITISTLIIYQVLQSEEQENRLYESEINLEEAKNFRVYYQAGKKVLIARALMQKPSLLILDEPTTYLDPRAKFDIMLKLKEIAYNDNISILASMHEVELVYRIADYVMVLDEGEIVAYDIPEVVFNDMLLQKVYEINTVRWNTLSGSFEIKRVEEPFIHVVSGAGSGIPVFRILVRLGYSFSTGILDPSDADYHIVESMNAKIYHTKPFEPVTNADITNTLSNLLDTKLVIDTGFPIGSNNRLNLRLLKELKDAGIKVFSLRDDNLNALIKVLKNEIKYKTYHQ